MTGDQPRRRGTATDGANEPRKTETGTQITPACDLTDPACYRFPVDRVDVIETHISRLYFAGDRVYKVKKPVHLDFLDYRDPAERRRFCEEEVRLNRRLAPDTYLGVVTITKNRDGQVGIDGEGEPVDYAVEMKRLPIDRMLDQRLAHGEVDNDCLNRLVERLIKFHNESPGGLEVASHGSAKEIEQLVRGNLDELETALGSPAPLQIAHIRRAIDDFVEQHASLLDARVDEGRIREGHGDLHAGNICDLGDEFAIYDCIEFSRSFRSLDVAAEISFLAMDLDHRGYRGFGGYLIHRYAERSRDHDLPRVAPLYKLHYALVRAKVASIRASELTGADADSANAEARQYLHLATTYTLPPLLLLMCGLPGSGKSTVARQLAAPLEGVIVRSDVVRKRIAGVPPQEHQKNDVDAGIYTPSMTDRTYAALLHEATNALRHHRSVIIDAASPSVDRRRPFHALARETDVPFVTVSVSAPDHVVVERLRARATDPTEVSDADESIYWGAKERFEAPDEFAPDERVVAHSGDVDVVSRALDAAIAQRNRLGHAATLTIGGSAPSERYSG